MVKDHLDSERGNLLPPLHGLLFPISKSMNSVGRCKTNMKIAYTEGEESCFAIVFLNICTCGILSLHLNGN